MTSTTKIKKILISDDDEDDQFIFKTAITEVNPDVEIKFFLTSQALIQYLLEVSIQEEPEELPDMIIGDMKIPFFDLKDITEIRTFKQFRKIPLYVFAEGYSDITKAEALKIGATEFYHKPNSLHTLKDIFTGIFSQEKKQIADDTTQAESAQTEDDMVAAE